MTSPDRNPQRGDTVTTLAARDHADLTTAARLVNDVIDRHRTDATLPALVAFNQALLDMRIGERYLAGGA